MWLEAVVITWTQIFEGLRQKIWERKRPKFSAIFDNFLLWSGKDLEKGSTERKSEKHLIHYISSPIGRKNDKLWSSNKKVIGDHVEPPNWTFSRDYILALRRCWSLKFLHALEIHLVLLAPICQPGFNYHGGMYLWILIVYRTCHVSDVRDMRVSRACGGRVKSHILLSFNFNFVNKFFENHQDWVIRLHRDTIPNGYVRGPPKNVKGEHLKFRLKFSMCVSITLGLVGITLQNFTRWRAYSKICEFFHTFYRYSV